MYLSSSLTPLLQYGGDTPDVPFTLYFNPLQKYHYHVSCYLCHFKTWRQRNEEMCNTNHGTWNQANVFMILIKIHSEHGLIPSVRLAGTSLILPEFTDCSSLMDII